MKGQKIESEKTLAAVGTDQATMALPGSPTAAIIACVSSDCAAAGVASLGCGSVSCGLDLSVVGVYRRSLLIRCVQLVSSASPDRAGDVSSLGCSLGCVFKF